MWIEDKIPSSVNEEEKREEEKWKKSGLWIVSVDVPTPMTNQIKDD